jgi:GT2 family glycosyltransferase
MKKYHTAIGILAFARPDELILTVESVMELSNLCADIYVLQNGMNEIDFASISEACPYIIAIGSPDNLGAAGGRNRLIEIAIKGDYEYLCFLDSDARLSSGALKKLLFEYPQLERPGLVSCVVHVIEEPERVHSSGVSLDRITLRDIHHSDIPSQRVFERDIVITTAAVISCEVLRVAPRFDTRIFAYWEDIDWCLEMGRVGYRHYVVRDAIAFHSEARSRFHPAIIYYTTRNHLLVAKKLGYSLHSLTVLNLLKMKFSDSLKRIFVMTPLSLNCFAAGIQALFHVLIGRWGVAPRWMHRSDEQFLETRLYCYFFQSPLFSLMRIARRKIRGT